MAIGSGIGSSIGIGVEGSYGTYQAPSGAGHWWEADKYPLEFKPRRVQGHGLTQGALAPKEAQRVQVVAEGGGTIEGSIFYKGMGLWLGQAMGSTAAPVQQAATTAYLQTHALGNDFGISKTIQVGVPNLGGTVTPYNFLGCKFPEVTFELGADTLWKMKVTVDAKDVTEVGGGAYVSPTYASGNKPFGGAQQTTFKYGAVGAEAAVAGVRKATVTLKRKLRLDNFYLDGTGRKTEPVMNGYVEITGSLETDYIDKTKFVDLFSADTALPSLVLVSTAVDLAGTAKPFFFQIQITDVHLDSSTPMVEGEDIVQPKISFTGLYDATNNPMTVTYQSTDTTL